MIKIVWIMLGSLSLGFGIFGIVIPGLPTTPFLLLSAALYLKSSRKLYRLLIGNRFLGPYISKFQDEKGLTLRTKIIAMLLMWSMIIVSSLVLIDNKNIDRILYIAGLIGSLVMGLIVPTIQTNTKS